MKTVVIGAGAIGGLVAGYLKLKDEYVSLLGHADSVKVIKADGLQISGVRGNYNIKIDISDKLTYRPDLVILSTKTQDIAAAIKDSLRFLEDTTILTMQNGIQADDILGKYVPHANIVSSIVMFGATYLEPGKVVHNFEGSWIIGKMFNGNIDERVMSVTLVLDKAFPTIVSEDLKGMKYLKIFVNANNCIPAILGISMQEAFSDLEISCIGIGIWREALEIAESCGINLLSLPDFPVVRLIKLTSLPVLEAAKIYSGIMVNLSKEPLYGSILQSIKRKRPSEIDYINGEFVSLAKQNNLRVPLNEKLVEMVHEVEATKKFFSKQGLVDKTKRLVH